MGPSVSPPYGFENACDDFYREIVQPIKANLDEARFLTAAILTAAAIEPLSGASLRANELTDRETYVAWVESAMSGYSDVGDTIYRTMRCGLLHDMRLDAELRGDEDVLPPAVILTAEDEEPQMDSDDPGRESLRVGVPHFVRAFCAAFEQFRKASGEGVRKGFPRRFRLTLIPTASNASPSSTFTQPASAFGNPTRFSQ